MKRFVITISAFLVIFAGLYSGIWFYNSTTVQTQTENAILELTKDLGGKKSDFKFSESSISGFPFNYKVQIEKPRFILNDPDISVDMSSEEPLVIVSDVLAAGYTATLPKNITVKNGEKLDENHSLRYETAATINVNSNAQNLLQLILSSINIGGNNTEYLIKTAKYSDNGYKYINPLNQEVIASADKLSIDIDIVGKGEYNLKTNVKNQFFSNLNELLSEDKKISGLNIDADILYNENSGDKFDFNKFILSSDSFSFDLKGTASSSNIEAFPYGDLTIKVSNYEEFIDFKASVLKNLVKGTGLPIFKIKDKQVAQLKDFIQKVASEKFNDGKDVTLSLKREEGQAINIGKYSFIEAVHLYKGGTIEKVTTPVSKEFVTEKDELEFE